MTRKILLMEWVLELLQFGGSHSGEAADPDAARDTSSRPLALRLDVSSGEDRPWITPKSIVGAFAAHLRRESDSDAARWLLGDAVDGSRPAPRPSRLRVLGSDVLLPHGKETSWRYRAAQDRRRGAASKSHLVRLEWMPAGTQVRLWAMADSALVGDGAWPLLSDAVCRATLGSAENGLNVWAPTLGGAKSTGHGQTRLSSFRTLELDLSRVDDLALFFGGLSPSKLRHALGAKGRSHQVTEPSPPEMLSESRWILDGPLYAGLHKGQDNDGQIGVLAVDDDGHPVVPGTSWKGVLRSRCEFILRSLGIQVCAGGSRGCGTCPCCQVFGGVVDGGEGASGLASRIVVHSSDVMDGDDHAQKRVEPHVHVAIDRFTGGGADSLLYRHEVVEQGTMTLTITRREGLPEFAEPLIDLALRDLADGLIGVGGMTSRGYGTVRRLDGKVLGDRWPAIVRELRVAYPGEQPVSEEST